MDYCDKITDTKNVNNVRSETMRDCVMLGSVTFDKGTQNTEFKKNLDIINKAIELLGFECEQNIATWQNLSSEFFEIRILKILYLHSKFHSEIKRTGFQVLNFITNFTFNLIRVYRDRVTLSKEDFWKKHIQNHMRIRYITDKQLRIIGNFLDSDAEYLLICEDDIILKSDPNKYLEEIIHIAKQHPNPLLITICNNSSYSKVQDYFGGKRKNIQLKAHGRKLIFLLMDAPCTS